MKNRLVVIPNTKKIILPSGWAKKGLAECHIELSGLCGMGCRYCSSNSSRWMRVHAAEFAACTVEQLGEPLTPKDNPELSYVWARDVVEMLRDELRGKSKSYGAGKTLALSQNTDPLSPVVDPKVTESVIRLLVERTSFRIRILTKNAAIGSDHWIKILREMGDRVTVSLSVGTLDVEWAAKIEIGTSTPHARLRALRRLQDERIPTYGMLCPMFPAVLESGRLDDLIDAIRPGRCEFIWAEPYNNRDNWEVLRDAHAQGSPEYTWFDRAFGPSKEPDLWSSYAANLYKALRLRAEAEGWLDRLKYMLYEHHISPEHVRSFCDLRGVSLQSIDDLGLSKNPEFRKLQEQAEISKWDRLQSPYDERVADPEPAFLQEWNPCLGRVEACFGAALTVAAVAPGS